MKRWLLMFLIATPALSATGSFRCGSDLVYEGDPPSRVLAKCGQPTDVSHSVAWRVPQMWRYGLLYYGDGLTAVPVEVWIYNLGPNTLMRRLRFEDGELVEIETLGYGFNPP